MKPGLSGKVVVVTGSGRGIGRSIAQVFAAEGARAVVATRSAISGQKTANRITQRGHEAWFYPIDVSDPGAVQAMVAETVSRYGRLDIVIHNAAVFDRCPVEKMSRARLDAMMSVNLYPCYYLCAAAARHMRRQGGGRILVTSSVTGPRVAMPGISHYAASKGAINAFIRSAALEFARDGITVNGVEPGYVATEAMDQLDRKHGADRISQYIPLGRLAKPEEIAYAMLFLASDQAHYITGQTIVVDGGAILPENPVFMEDE